ncbi:MAG: isoprenylcysteine carboxylmethyltransferase family protein [Candidatus Omnitrophica bacterium]|nr:isoprenylcysteine carboxylmethyltransferase family protein [Candidatus Omnitrophota bacterium]
MKNRIRINGIAIALSIVFILLFSQKLLRGPGYFADELWEVSGIALIFFGQLLRVSSRGYKSECSKNGNSLVTSGPYSMVRNPMYLGILLIGAGVVLFLFHWWVFLIFLAVFITRYLGLFAKEEGVGWFKREIPSIVAVLAIVLVVESWEELKSGNWQEAIHEFVLYLAIFLCYSFLVIFLSRQYENKTK